MKLLFIFVFLFFVKSFGEENISSFTGNTIQAEINGDIDERVVRDVKLDYDFFQSQGKKKVKIIDN